MHDPRHVLPANAEEYDEVPSGPDLDGFSIDVERIERAVREILVAIGEDPDRDGLLRTPARVAAMYTEVFGGLHDDPKRHLEVTFDAMPVRLLADFRRHFREVRRELRLLALAHEDVYPVAKSLTQLFHRVDEIQEQMLGLPALEAALSDGTERADIVLHMPPGSAGTMAHLLDLLELADEFCRAERLLTLAATPQQYQLQRWYLGEFVRQARGESPLPWAGTYEVDPSYRQSAS